MGHENSGCESGWFKIKSEARTKVEIKYKNKKEYKISKYIKIVFRKRRLKSQETKIKI